MPKVVRDMLLGNPNQRNPHAIADDALVWIAVLVRMLEDEGYTVEVTGHELESVDVRGLVVKRDHMHDTMVLTYELVR